MEMKQTDLTWSHAKYWGCRVCCAIATAERLLHSKLTKEEYEFLIKTGIQLGYILDNDLPVDPKNEWYRCWLADPINFMKLAIKKCGGLTKSIEELPSKEGATSIVRRWKTETGSHYTADYYDPWPELKRGELLGERYWKIELYEKERVEM
jgi:hypothetical protein